MLFSEHAIEQIKRRGISRNRIKEVVNVSSIIIPTYRGRQLRRKRYGGKILEVVARTEEEKIIVVTAYYLDN